MGNLISKIKYSLNKSLLIQNIVFGFISIQFILLDKAFSFNPFIVALLFSSYFLSPCVFITSSCVALIAGSFISIKYFLELLFVESIFLICAYISKIIKNNDVLREKVLLFSFIGILIIFYFILDRSFYTFVNTFSLGILSFVLSLGGKRISLNIKEKNFLFKEEDMLIAFLFLNVILIPLKVIYVFFIYLFVILLRRMNIYQKRYIYLFIIFLSMYFFGNYVIDEVLKFLIPCLVFFLLPRRYYYLFLIVFASFSYVFNPSFYLTSSFYMGVLSFFANLLFSNNILQKLEEFINKNEEIRKEKYNEYTLKLVNILNSFDELISLLQKDEFDKKEDIDEDYYMKKEHKRLFNKEISFFKEPLNKMMTLIDDKQEQYVNDYNVKCYSFSKAYTEGENGDFNVFIEENNIFSSLLVDGMGHNAVSKKIASYVASLYLHMKHLSSSEKEIITCLNAFIKGKTYEELYATFDLIKIDLVKGIFYSYQYGSFPTFLIRDRKVIKISNIFPPVGIISCLEVAPYVGEIKPNDIFVQLSDGFKENIDKEIERFFTYYNGQDDSLICDYLFDYLSSKSSLCDDKTLIVLKILRNNEK